MVSVPGPLQVDPQLFVTENGTPLGRLLSFDELCQLTRTSEPAMRAKIGAGIGPPVIQKRRWAKIFCWEGAAVEWLGVGARELETAET
jgi:hypothetical protein